MGENVGVLQAQLVGGVVPKGGVGYGAARRIKPLRAVADRLRADPCVNKRENFADGFHLEASPNFVIRNCVTKMLLDMSTLFWGINIAITPG